MDFDYKIFGREIHDANASAFISYIKDESQIFLHPVKCDKCHKFFDEIEDQIITGINHEVQESLIFKILLNSIGDYKNEWFDGMCMKNYSIQYHHSCKGIRGFFLPHNRTSKNSGYFR